MAPALLDTKIVPRSEALSIPYPRSIVVLPPFLYDRKIGNAPVVTLTGDGKTATVYVDAASGDVLALEVK